MMSFKKHCVEKVRSQKVYSWGFPDDTVVENLPNNAGAMGLISRITHATRQLSPLEPVPHNCCREAPVGTIGCSCFIGLLALAVIIIIIHNHLSQRILPLCLNAT